MVAMLCGSVVDMRVVRLSLTVTLCSDRGTASVGRLSRRTSHHMGLVVGYCNSLVGTGYWSEAWRLLRVLVGMDAFVDLPAHVRQRTHMPNVQFTRGCAVLLAACASARVCLCVWMACMSVRARNSSLLLLLLAERFHALVTHTPTRALAHTCHMVVHHPAMRAGSRRRHVAVGS